MLFTQVNNYHLSVLWGTNWYCNYIRTYQKHELINHWCNPLTWDYKRRSTPRWPCHHYHHDPHPGKLPKQRTCASVPGLQFKCSFPCPKHTAHCKLTLEMTCQPRPAFGNSVPWPALWLHFVKLFLCVCISSLPVPLAQLSEACSLFNCFLVIL